MSAAIGGRPPGGLPYGLDPPPLTGEFPPGGILRNGYPPLMGGYPFSGPACDLDNPRYLPNMGYNCTAVHPMEWILAAKGRIASGGVSNGMDTRR